MLTQNYEKIAVKRTNVFGLNLHSIEVLNKSSENALPIVLVCGLSISSRYMIPAAVALSEEFNVYCPDLPGFGKSDKPLQTLNIAELAVALNNFLEESKIKRPVIVGHSFGCQIAIEFALRYPEKLQQLVLAAPSGDPDIKSLFSYFGRLLFDAFLEPFSLIPIAIRDYFRAGVIRGFRTSQYALMDPFDEKLPQVNTSTLVIRGAKDPIVSDEWVKKITKLMPNSNLVTIKEAAHAVNYNSPKTFSKVLVEFIKCESTFT